MSANRNLELIKKSGSTSRILNLHLIYELNQGNEEFKTNALFKNPRLNRSMIIKHTTRASESYLFEKKRVSSTKVVLPFAHNDLRIGATNVFIGQRHFRQALTDIVGGYQTQESINSDAQLLTLLDGLPSLDPFLLRERLKLLGNNVARCYFQISDADLAKMQAFVGGEIQKLIDKAFSDTPLSTGALSGQMAQKILSDENTEQLAPLKATLGLSGSEWNEGVFCWKGFLYYKWCFNTQVNRIAETLSGMQELDMVRCDFATKQIVREMRDRGRETIRHRVKKVAELLQTYDTAFKAMADDGNPSAFRKFLLDSPQLFIEIGDNIGIVSHISSFWEFKVGRRSVLEGSELLDVFKEIEACGWAETQKHSTEMTW